MGWKVYLVTMIDNISLDRIGTDDAYKCCGMEGIARYNDR